MCLGYSPLYELNFVLNKYFNHFPTVFVRSYELTYTAVWWQEMLQGKEKSKNFLCLSTQEEKKSFNFQVGSAVLIS